MLPANPHARRRFATQLARFTAPPPAAKPAPPRDYALEYQRAEAEDQREIDGLWLDLGQGDA